MKKREHKKINVIIVILCVTIIAMGIGFMALSMQLETYRNTESTFDVRFVSVQKAYSIKGGDLDPSALFEIVSDGKILNMNFLMHHVHDEVDYEITVRNEGDIEASIVQIFSSPNFLSKDTMDSIAPISIYVSDVSGKLLEPGEETVVKVSAVYNAVEEDSTKKDLNEISLSGNLAILAQSKNKK